MFSMVVFTLYLGAFKTLMKIYFPTPHCPVYYNEQDAENEAYKKLAWDDYKINIDQREGLMGCYCERHSSAFAPWTLFTRLFHGRMVCLEIHFLWLA
jgi:hypothetical protein